MRNTLLPIMTALLTGCVTFDGVDRDRLRDVGVVLSVRMATEFGEWRHRQEMFRMRLQRDELENEIRILEDRKKQLMEEVK